MVVIGNESLVIDWIDGKTCDAMPFDPSIGTAKSIPVVDAAIAYDCRYTHATYVLIARNVLYMDSLRHNLITPFIMRETGLIVNEEAKIHCSDPDMINHSIFLPELNLQIPLKLNGIFSNFTTHASTNEEVSHCSTFFITPDSTYWDPYSEHYSLNEDMLVDWEGNIVRHKCGKTKLLEYNQSQSLDSLIDANISSSFSPTFQRDQLIQAKFINGINHVA